MDVERGQRGSESGKKGAGMRGFLGGIGNDMVPYSGKDYT